MNRLICGIIGACLLQACQISPPKNASPTFREAFFSQSDRLSSYLDSSFPKALVDLDSGWMYLSKDSIAGIKRNLPDFPIGEQVNLPHRILAPNHSFWYQKEVNLTPGILYVDADDGAQLWANGVRLPRSAAGNYFELEASGTFILTVRSINNAMAGGLRRVAWVSKTEFGLWYEQQKQVLDSVLTVAKVGLLTDLDLQAELKTVVGWRDKKEQLEDFPILFTQPVLLLDSDQSWYLRWVSEKPGEARVLHSDGRTQILSSKDGVFTLPLEGDSVRFSLFQGQSEFGFFQFSVPEFGNEVKVALWGDSQGGWETFHKIGLGIRSHRVALSIGAGDLVNDGSEPWAYARFLQLLHGMNAPQLPVPGNHDYDGFYDELDPKLLRKFILGQSKASYGFQKIGPLSILTLDPNENFPVGIPATSSQGVWMEQVLNSEQWSNSPWKMIVLHQPPFSQGWPGYQGELAIRQLLTPYFHRGLIDLVVAGHTHDYERMTQVFSGHSVHFFIVGGAGGGLEPEGQSSGFPVMDKIVKQHHFGILEVNPRRVDWQVIGLDGQLLDRFSVDRSLENPD